MVRRRPKGLCGESQKSSGYHVYVYVMLSRRSSAYEFYFKQVGIILWSEPPLPWLQWQVLGGHVHHPPFLSSSDFARHARGAAQASYVAQ